jgi:uncharacterized protein
MNNNTTLHYDSAPSLQTRGKTLFNSIQFTKSDLYRHSRMLHAYLSAFAFLALIFFALTGLFLNHPDWFDNNKPATHDQTLTLPLKELTPALQPSTSLPALATIVARAAPVRGIYKSGEIVDGEAHIRMEGVTGKSDIIINLTSGVTEITQEKAGITTIIQDLHRGKNSGQVWQTLIDITAVMVLALSLIGYILFFSIRFRLATSLKLTAASLLLLGGIFWFFVP